MKKGFILLTTVLLLGACGQGTEEEAKESSESKVNVMQEMQADRENYIEASLVNLSYQVPSAFTLESEEGEPTQVYRGDAGTAIMMYGVQPLDVKDEQTRNDFIQQNIVGKEGQFEQTGEETVTVAGQEGYRITGTLTVDETAYAVETVLIPNREDSYIAYTTSVLDEAREEGSAIMDKFIQGAELRELTADDKKTIEKMADPMSRVNYRLKYKMPDGWEKQSKSDENGIVMIYDKEGALAKIDMTPTLIDLGDEQAREKFVQATGEMLGEIKVTDKKEITIDGEKAYRYDADFTVQNVPAKGAIIITEKDNLMATFLVVAPENGTVNYNDEVSALLEQVTFEEAPEE